MLAIFAALLQECCATMHIHYSRLFLPKVTCHTDAYWLQLLSVISLQLALTDVVSLDTCIRKYIIMCIQFNGVSLVVYGMPFLAPN